MRSGRSELGVVVGVVVGRSNLGLTSDLSDLSELSDLSAQQSTSRNFRRFQTVQTISDGSGNFRLRDSRSLHVPLQRLADISIKVTLPVRYG